MEQLLVLVGSSKFREQGRTNQNSSKYEYCTRQKDVNIFFNETHPSISKGDGWEGGGGGSRHQAHVSQRVLLRESLEREEREREGESESRIIVLFVSLLFLKMRQMWHQSPPLSCVCEPYLCTNGFLQLYPITALSVSVSVTVLASSVGTCFTDPDEAARFC